MIVGDGYTAGNCRGIKYLGQMLLGGGVFLLIQQILDRLKMISNIVDQNLLVIIQLNDHVVVILLVCSPLNVALKLRFVAVLLLIFQENKQASDAGKKNRKENDIYPGDLGGSQNRQETKILESGQG